MELLKKNPSIDNFPPGFSILTWSGASSGFYLHLNLFEGKELLQFPLPAVPVSWISLVHGSLAVNQLQFTELWLEC